MARSSSIACVRTLRCALIVITVTLPLAGQAEAHSWRHPWGHPSDAGPSSFERYFLLKGGGLFLGGDGVADGAYLGMEVGSSAQRVLDIGFAMDWFHRHSRDVEVLFETDHGFDPPVRGVISNFESSTDFVPFGITAKLRIPLANQTLRPFISGMVGYEVLYLSFYERNPEQRPWDALLDRSERFAGAAWQAAAGVEFAVSPTVGI